MIAAIPKDLPVEKTIEMLIRLQFAQSDVTEERLQEIIKKAQEDQNLKKAIDKTKESK